jgi:transcriptional regulator with XRE-family HTH domain
MSHHALQEQLTKAVRQGLIERGWSQAELARRAGISEKHLSQMLKGRTEGSLSMWDQLLTILAEGRTPVPGVCIVFGNTPTT